MPATGRAVQEPVIVVALPRSFSSVIVAMLGQHPQMFALPETQLFAAETVAGWLERCTRAWFPMGDGLLRSVAELLLGEQSERTVTLARHWLMARSAWPTPDVFRLLGARVAPRVVVEKSPMVVYEPQQLARMHEAFPRARFVHLVRHPTGFGQSILKHLDESRRDGEIPGWLTDLAFRGSAVAGEDRDADPQLPWLKLQRNIVGFLDGVPASQQLRIRGEDVMASPRESLASVVRWLGLRDDDMAIEAMLHPERSPFARVGPPNAPHGNDIFFLRSPELRPFAGHEHRLDRPMPWREDDTTYTPEVVEMARSFGYE